MNDIELSVSQFIALVNQTLEYAYPNVIVIGELANFRISKNRWLYFDLKDEESIIRCFGTVYQLPGPLEDGMLLKVLAQPRLHPQYGFSLNVMKIQPSGEGSIKKAASLLEAKLTAEGLFAPTRKRPMPHPPASIGLITSAESAAYSDFIKVLSGRWGGIDIVLADVQVQGEAAIEQIVQSVENFNQQAQPPDILVIIRGGGNSEDLQVFNSEQVVRSVAGSRIPTLVAIGHERDFSLSELAADQRASTPSNAAELVAPDREAVRRELQSLSTQIRHAVLHQIEINGQAAQQSRADMHRGLEQIFKSAKINLSGRLRLLAALNPSLALERGFALVRKGERIIRSTHDLAKGDIVNMTFKDGRADARVYNLSKEQ